MRIDRFLTAILVCSVLYSCTTTYSLMPTENTVPKEPVPTEEETKTPSFDPNGAYGLSLSETVPPFSLQVVTQERPIYVPETPRASQGVGGFVDGKIGTKTAVDGNTINPYEWNGTVTVYDFNPNFQYRIYTQPLRMTVIDLEPEEVVLGDAVIGDSARWKIGAQPGTGRGGRPIQSLYIKPDTAGLETSLIINTNKRRYMCVLYSTGDLYMAGVQWRYATELPVRYLAAKETKFNPDTGENSQAVDSDPSVNKNYEVTLSGDKPYWAPVKVFDNGKMTYFVFIEKIVNMRMPGITRANGDLVNYRPNGNLIIVDGVAEDYAVFLKDKKLVVTNKALKK